MPNTLNLGVIQRTDGFRTVDDVGQAVIVNATNLDIGEHNARVEASLSFFVDGDTEKYLFRYKSRGTGRMQKMGLNSAPAEVKGGFTWEVGLPIDNYGAALGTNDFTFAHMTVDEWAFQVNTVFDIDIATVRDAFLRPLFNKAGIVDWTGPLYPDQVAVDVMPLANGDGTLYPPGPGETSPSTRNHYLGVAADSTTLTDNNNPIPRGTKLLRRAYGAPTTGSPIVTFINSAQTASAMNLSAFVDPSAYFISLGANSPTLKNIPANIPGSVIGATVDSLIAEWDQVPAGFMLQKHLGAPNPLLRRVVEARSGLGKNLQLRARKDNPYPLLTSYWQNIYGFGVGERLNGVAIDLTASGGASTYTTPTAFA